MAKKTFTVEPSNTHAVWKLLPGGTYSSDSSPYAIRVGYETGYRHSYGSYEWYFDITWRAGSGIFSSLTVESAYLEFYYYSADNPLFMPEFELVTTTTAPSAALSDTSAWTLIDTSSNVIATVSDARGDKKQLIRVPIDDNSAISTAINYLQGYFIGIRRTDTTRDTRIEVGGENLIYGTGTGWASIGAGEIKGLPKLVITATLADATHVEHDLRYTTSDPTTNQNTPSNSLGGYFSPNEVFTTAQIGDPVSSTDTTILIDSSSSLPSNTGIAQVGPEIISFEGIDSANRQLTGITRAVAPLASFPSQTDEFSEYIRYLVTANLFDKRPSSDLVQYRCLAVIQTSATALNNVEVALIQNTNEDVQVDIGIEVPAFDATSGTAAAAVTSGDTTFTSTSAAVVGKTTGYYDGGYIVMDPSGTAFEAIIDSYDEEGGTATFILDRSMPTLNPAPDFRINPAPSQTVTNEKTAPNNNNGRFLGFLSQGGESSIGYGSIRENGSTMNQHDVFYLWVKRTFLENKKSSNDTGAIVFIQGTQ